MPIPVRYQPPTSMTMSSQRTIPYWDAIKIAEINPANGKSTVPKMTRRRATESSSVGSSVIECGKSEPESIGKWGEAFAGISFVRDFVAGKFVTVGFAGIAGSLRVGSVTDAMKRFLSMCDCPSGESESGGLKRPRDRLPKV